MKVTDYPYNNEESVFRDFEYHVENVNENDTKKLTNLDISNFRAENVSVVI